MTRPRCLVISNSRIERDPRVHRQIRALEGEWDIDVVGNGPIETLSCRPIASFEEEGLAPGEGEGFRSYARRVGGRLGLFGKSVAYLAARGARRGGRAEKAFKVLERRMYWRMGRLKALIRRGSYDLVIGNDFHALPLMFALKGRPGRIYDAHEYAPGQFGKGFFAAFRRIYTRGLLSRYLRRCDRVLTVNEGMADLHAREFGVRPLVAWNGPPYHDLHPVTPAPGRVRLVHSGLIDPKRRIERMIELMSLLDERFELDLYLVGDTDSAYYRKLLLLAEKVGRVNFPAPVPMTQLVRTLNAYDVGITLVKPETVNQTFGLPNKFFDSIQARIAVASWPRVEIRKIVERYGVGFCTADFTLEAMAAALNSLTAERIMAYKEACHAAARELSSERASALIRELATEVAKGAAG